MPSPNDISRSNQEETDPIVATGSQDYLALCSLVLSAVGIDHAYNHRHNGLTVPEESAESARYHLDQYFAENRGWPERPAPPQQSRITSNPPTLLIIGEVVTLHDTLGWYGKPD